MISSILKITKKTRNIKCSGLFFWWPQRESNPYQKFRKLLFYPLNYGTKKLLFYPPDSYRENYGTLFIITIMRAAKVNISSHKNRRNFGYIYASFSLYEKIHPYYAALRCCRWQ